MATQTMLNINTSKASETEDFNVAGHLASIRKKGLSAGAEWDPNIKHKDTSDPNSFENILKKIQGDSKGGDLVKKGKATLAMLGGGNGNFITKALNVAARRVMMTVSGDYLGAAAQAKKVAEARKPLEKTFAKAKQTLGQTKDPMEEQRAAAARLRAAAIAKAAYWNRPGTLGGWHDLGGAQLSSQWHNLGGPATGGSALGAVATRKLKRANETAEQIKARNALGNVVFGDAARLRKMARDKEAVAIKSEAENLDIIAKNTGKMVKSFE